MRKVKLGLSGLGSTITYMFGPILKYLENGEIVAVNARTEKSLQRAEELPCEEDPDFAKLFSDIKAKGMKIRKDQRE